MTERERLTELIDDYFGMDSAYYDVDKYELADHLFSNGVIVPKVKIGDEVWYELYGEIQSATVYHAQGCVLRRGFRITTAYAKDTDGLELCFDEKSLGKGVFLTREEAEKALKERE